MQRRAATRSILLVAITILMLFAVSGCTTGATRATIEVEWEKTYAEPDYNNESSCSIQQSSDGGYLIITRTDCGYRPSMSPPPQIASCGYQLTKTDANGNVQWVLHKTREWYPIYSVDETPDGGYIVVSSERVGKIDSTGSEEWEIAPSYKLNYSTPLQQTPDGGYILVSTERVTKIDSTGTPEWEMALTSAVSTPTPFQQTSDGGYLAVSGRTLIKMDAARNELWQRTFDGFDAFLNEVAVVQSSDGGYILAGDADCHFNPPGSTAKIDFCYARLTKIDGSGNVEWDTQWHHKSFGPSYDIRLTQDGGYLFFQGLSGADLRWTKVDAFGRTEWDKPFQSTGAGYSFSLQQTSGGGYAIFGGTAQSNSEYWISVKEDTSVFWLSEMDASANLKWDAKLSCSGRITAIAQTSDGGYVTVGHRYDATAQRANIWLMKLRITPP